MTTHKQVILVVEDEADIREMIAYNLLKAGFQVAAVEDAEEALGIIQSQPPHLVVLDLMLPGMSGVELCSRLRQENPTAGIPVVMLTARGEEADIVSGLDAGADDYITKPFSPKVLIARLRAVLRRARCALSEEDAGRLIRAHGLVIDPRRHSVRFKGKSVELTHTEFRLLGFLARRPGWVFTRNQILDGVHGSSYAITDRAIDVLVVGLRRKLGAAGTCIETVRGVGYRFRE